jgi:small conductance mechanosensitive channel
VALIVLFIFWVISKFAGRITAKALSRHHAASNLLENFARRTTGGVVFVVGILMALSILGVQIGPLMAALGAGGFIVGFALQDTLGNFASGLMIMVYRPFDVDDYIAVAGGEGTVKEMSLVSTTLLTVDNKVLIIPNKKAWSDTIVNFTGRDIRRVDLVFGIGYDDNIRHATDVLMEVAGEHKLVLDEPPVMVNVDELADSSVNLLCRPWVKTKDYWAVRWDLTRQVKERFDAEGISIPFPQRDVHMHPESVST